MMFFYIAPELERTLLSEHPASILEISMSGKSGCRYGRLAVDCQKRVSGGKTVSYTDRIDMEELLGNEGGTAPYRRIQPMSILDSPEKTSHYDMIIMADLFETFDQDTVHELVKMLYPQISNSLIIIVPKAMMPENPFADEGFNTKTLTLSCLPEDVCILHISNK
jgi:hypothetical protein